MRSKRVITRSACKEPEGPSGSNRQIQRISGKQPRAKPSSGVKNRKPLRAGEEQEFKPPLANGGVQPRIAERAYEFYQRRGGNHGQDLNDWFLAEQEVMAEDSREGIER